MVLALFAVGCHRSLPRSMGPGKQIYVLADPSDWTVLEAPIREAFEKVLHTPREEKTFSIQRVDVETFEQQKHNLRKNLIVVAPLDATHATGAFLRALLSAKVQDALRTGALPVFWKKDIWARDQTLIILTGRDLEEAVDNLQMESNRLYRVLDAARNKMLKEFIYQWGERTDVTAELAGAYGWSVRVPFEYRIVESYPDSGFVVLARGEPNRWLFVYWEDGVSPDRLTPDWCIEKRDEITHRFFNKDRIAPGEMETYETEFAGKLAVVLQGVWENERLWSGGPFKSYAFVDMDLNRFFWVDVGVFAPNKEKEKYLRQVDLIARTFTAGGALSTN